MQKFQPQAKVCVNNPDNDYHLCDGTIQSIAADGTYTITFTEDSAAGETKEGFRADELVQGWLLDD